MIGFGVGCCISMFTIVFICQLVGAFACDHSFALVQQTGTVVRGPDYACPHLDYFSTPLHSDSKTPTPSSAISSSGGLKQSIPLTPKKKSDGQMTSSVDKQHEGSSKTHGSVGNEP
uniref:Secreted protein n=1 Tax=Parascaris equorum TaxID=6256 RepID=A0A914S2B6_PAREQ